MSSSNSNFIWLYNGLVWKTGEGSNGLTAYGNNATGQGWNILSGIIDWPGGEGWFQVGIGNTPNAYVQMFYMPENIIDMQFIQTQSDGGNLWYTSALAIPELTQVNNAIITPIKFHAPKGKMQLGAYTPSNTDYVNITYAYVVPLNP